MPQELLDVAHVRTTAQEMDCDGMPEQMWMQVRGTRLAMSVEPTKEVTDLLLRQALSFAVQEQRTVIRTMQEGAPNSEVVPDHRQCPRHERHLSSQTPLAAADDDRFPSNVDVTQVESQTFAEAQRTAVQEFQVSDEAAVEYRDAG